MLERSAGGDDKAAASDRRPGASRLHAAAAAHLPGRSGNGNLVTWEHDGKYYQFWNDGADDGKFTITNVRPGTYTLHAFADGVLGEFAKTDITVEAGKDLDLGKLEWKPVRYGKQIWEIGYPDRTGDKFFKGDGDNYWLWGWCLRYPLLFPNDITYTIGKSDYRKDWFFEQVPHGESTAWLNPDAKDPANQRFGWVKAESSETYPQTDQSGPWRIYGRGRATTWTIKFNMDKAPQGQAALRVALAGADGGGGLAVGVNGKERRHHPDRLHQRPALQHQQERLAGIHPEVRRRAAEAGRKRNDAHRPRRRTHHRRRVRLPAAGAQRGLKSSLPFTL